MPFIYPFSTVVLDVPQGQKVAFRSHLGAVGQLYLSSTGAKPGLFYFDRAIDSEYTTPALYCEQIQVSVENGFLEYDIDTSPFVQQEWIAAPVANAAARTALTGLADGTIVIQLDTNQLWEYKSSSWFPINYLNNSTTTAPTVNDDLSDGYAVGSTWVNTTTGIIYVARSVAAGAAVWIPHNLEEYAVAMSDMTTAITTGTTKAYFRLPYACNFLSVRASLVTASSSGTPTVDINKNGTTILSTKLTIDANEKTSVTAAVPAVISVSTGAYDDEMTFDIDVAGTGAAGLIAYITLARTA